MKQLLKNRVTRSKGVRSFLTQDHPYVPNGKNYVSIFVSRGDLNPFRTGDELHQLELLETKGVVASVEVATENFDKLLGYLKRDYKCFEEVVL